MVEEKVIRIMEEKDLIYVPDVREMFEEHGHHGDYFFFVIEDDQEEIIGYLLAKKEEKRAVILSLEITKDIEEERSYKNMATANLYEYARNIKDCYGKPSIFQVCFA